MTGGRDEPDLRLPDGPLGRRRRSRPHRWGTCSTLPAGAYDALGFGAAAGRDEMFQALAQAGIVEPTSKLDSLRVLEEAGISPPSSAAVKRRLSVCHEAETAHAEIARSKVPIWSLVVRGGHGRLRRSMCAWGQPRSCSPTSPRATSRRTRPTSSASPVAAKNAPGTTDHRRAAHRLPAGSR